MMKKTENGAIMIEGIIVVTMTLFMLVWLLSLGFLYYQRYMTTVVTNDVSVKIASTFNNPSSDIIMGFVETEDLRDRDLYRNYSKDYALLSANEERAQKYVRYILDNSNFTGVVKKADVKLELVIDSGARKHVMVTTTVDFNTPFGFVLDFFGMDDASKFAYYSCADCTDLADYSAMVNLKVTLGSGALTSGEKFTNSIVKVINSFTKAFNQFSK